MMTMPSSATDQKKERTWHRMRRPIVSLLQLHKELVPYLPAAVCYGHELS